MENQSYAHLKALAFTKKLTSSLAGTFENFCRMGLGSHGWWEAGLMVESWEYTFGMCHVMCGTDWTVIEISFEKIYICVLFWTIYCYFYLSTYKIPLLISPSNRYFLPSLLFSLLYVQVVYTPFCASYTTTKTWYLCSSIWPSSEGDG